MLARNWILCAAFLWVGSASCGNTTTEPEECVRGTIGCRCESDDSCNADLVCDRYGICAREDAAGTGGSGGGTSGAGGKGGSAGMNATGGKGGGGTGGVTGDAGDTGDAGEMGSGGRNPTAGRSGLAGTAGSGGDAGSGGSSAGTSGSAGTAGSAGDTAGTSGSAGVANAGTSGGGAGGTSGGAGAGNGGGGTGGVACTMLTVDDVMKRRASSPEAASYLYDTAPIGEAANDAMTVEFYSSSFGAGFNGEDTGTFQIGAGDDWNYATCSRCLRLIQDDGATLFMGTDGEMSIPPLSDHMEGYPNLTLSDVTFSEVTIDQVTFETTLVPQGACFQLDSLAVALARPPSTWTCDEDYYFDDHCDCGCGIRDLDCADGTFGVCEYCNCPGEGTDCMTTSVSMSDNAICL